MVEWMIQVLSRGGAAATANKKPLTCSMSQYSRFDQYSARFGRESTVGAGTPILACLDRVLFSGDKISQIQGAMSGTLGFVASKLENKAKFSDVVREAKRLGYTEPDPRDDLSGLDVARKALILSRISGMQAELEDVKIEALYPKSFANLDLEEFMDRLPELDEDMSAKVKDAESKGCVLRYLGTVDIPGNRIEVGLFQVPKNSVLGSLQGSDNLVSIVSEKFPASSPLVIRGSGAGSEVTAAGVVADIISIAKSSAF